MLFASASIDCCAVCSLCKLFLVHCRKPLRHDLWGWMFFGWMSVLTSSPGMPTTFAVQLAVKVLVHGSGRVAERRGTGSL